MASWNVRGFKKHNRIIYYKDLINSHHVGVFYISEYKVSKASFTNPFFQEFHKLFSNDGSFNNFEFFQYGRIWIKLDHNSISFFPLCKENEFIHGFFSYGLNHFFALIIMYVENLYSARKTQWDSLK